MLYVVHGANKLDETDLIFEIRDMTMSGPSICLGWSNEILEPMLMWPTLTLE